MQKLKIDLVQNEIRIWSDTVPQCPELTSGICITACRPKPKATLALIALILEKHLDTQCNTPVLAKIIRTDVARVVDQYGVPWKADVKKFDDALRMTWHRGIEFGRSFKTSPEKHSPNLEQLLNKCFVNTGSAQGGNLALGFDTAPLGIQLTRREVIIERDESFRPASNAAPDSDPIVQEVAAYLGDVERRFASVPLLSRLGLVFDDLRVPLSAAPFDHLLTPDEIAERERFRLSESVEAAPEIRNRIYAFRGPSWSPENIPDQRPAEAWIRPHTTMGHPAQDNARARVGPDREPGLIVLGDPGSGKTQFLKDSTRTFARQAGSAISKQATLTRVRIPVYAHLAQVVKELSEPEYLRAHLQRANCLAPDAVLSNAQAFGAAVLIALARSQELSPLLFSLLWRIMWPATMQTDGPSLVLYLDAWDEVGQHQTTLAPAFRDFATASPVQIILSSRVVGYTNSNLPSALAGSGAPFNKIQLSPFDREKTVLFINNFFEKIMPEAATNMLAELEHRPSLSGMIQNPLLATLLCKTYWARLKTGKGSLPATRGELYEAILRGLLGEWPTVDKDEQPDAELIEAELRFLEELAYHMFPGETLSLAAGVDFLWGQTGYMAALDSSHPLRRLAGTDRGEGLLHTLCKHGALVPVFDRTDVSFLHLTFQEYFVARAISRRDWQAIAHSHYVDPMWTEPLSLLAGILNGPNSEYVRNLIAGMADDYALRHLEIAVRALFEIPPKAFPLEFSEALFSALIKPLAHPGIWHRPDFLIGLLHLWGERSFPQLLEMINATDDDVRKIALTLLVDCGTRAVLIYKNYLERAQDHDSLSLVVHMTARYPAQDYIPAMLRLLTCEYPDIRILAGAVLGKLSEHSLPLLLKMASTAGHDALLSVIRAIGFCQTGQALPFLAKQVATQKDSVALVSVAAALGQIESPQSVPLLVRLCRHKAEVVVEAALEALAKLELTEFPEPRVLLTYAHHANPKLRASLLRLFRTIRHPDTITIAHRALSDADETVCYEAILTLHAAGVAELRAEVTKMLTTASTTTRKRLLQEVTLSPFTAMATINALLNDGDESIRSEAICAVAKSGSPAHAVICHALDDGAPAVRRTAVQAMADIGTAADIAQLIKSLGDSAWDVQVAAAQAIAVIARRNKIAVPWADFCKSAIYADMVSFREQIQGVSRLLR